MYSSRSSPEVAFLQNIIRSKREIKFGLDKQLFDTRIALDFVRRAVEVGVPAAKEEFIIPDDPDTKINEARTEEQLLAILNRVYGVNDFNDLQSVNLSEEEREAKDKMKRIIVFGFMIKSDIRYLSSQIQTISNTRMVDI
ncbi:MAG: hypothetical protein HYY52_08315 [Candidatus Melainabacteria bacterium]|nr:hypothetical protein [Candidatus Melainabacteria bacterium]